LISVLASLVEMSAFSLALFPSCCEYRVTMHGGSYDSARSHLMFTFPSFQR
jgi:hypothetical protein